MKKYQIYATSHFRKDIQVAKKRGYDILYLEEVVRTISEGKHLSPKYRDHTLNGQYSGQRECHITSDWLLIYYFKGDDLILVLSRTGTHSDLF